jgi:hypothetical protein
MYSLRHAHRIYIRWSERPCTRPCVQPTFLDISHSTNAGHLPRPLLELRHNNKNSRLLPARGKSSCTAGRTAGSSQGTQTMSPKMSIHTLTQTRAWYWRSCIVCALSCDSYNILCVSTEVCLTQAECPHRCHYLLAPASESCLETDVRSACSVKTADCYEVLRGPSAGMVGIFVLHCVTSLRLSFHSCNYGILTG